MDLSLSECLLIDLALNDREDKLSAEIEKLCEQAFENNDVLIANKQTSRDGVIKLRGKVRAAIGTGGSDGTLS